jgi:hypothetical protein
MIHAGHSELRKAFFIHSTITIETNPKSYNLLLFYAVESGLKSIYLRSNNLNTTERITDIHLLNSHDLSRWVKELKLPASIRAECHGFKLKRDGSHRPLREAHQAWRYNVEIEPRDQRKIVIWLKTLKKWIEENL